jgi:pimeloyl-ACP methyl ester carboxylesterase
VYGDTDPNAPTAALVSVYLSHARPTLATIRHSGHYPFFEQPDDFFASVLAFVGALPRP